MKLTVYTIDGITPVVDPTAFVHPSAVLIGDVIVGPGVYVGPCASLRGDFGRLEVRAGANIQDCCVMHGFPGTDTIVEEDGHIGHGAILHGCIVQRNALVGMNAVVNDNAVIGESAMVAAMAFVKAGFVVPPRTLVAGVPGKLIRTLTEEELAWKIEGTRELPGTHAAQRRDDDHGGAARGARGEPASHRRRRAAAAVGAEGAIRAERRRALRCAAAVALLAAFAASASRSGRSPPSHRSRFPRRRPRRSGSRRPTKPTIPNSPLGDMIRFGRDVFVDTQRYAKKYVGNGLNCQNCHLDAGRLANSAPLWAAYVAYPAFMAKNRRVDTFAAATGAVLSVLDERTHAARGRCHRRRPRQLRVLARDGRTRGRASRRPRLSGSCPSPRSRPTSSAAPTCIACTAPRATARTAAD